MQDIVNTQVRTVNGAQVDCLKDLVAKVESCKKEYVEFGLEYNQVSGQTCAFRVGSSR